MSGCIAAGFAAAAILGASLGSVAVMVAIGGSSLIFAVLSFIAAYQAGECGYDDLALIYIVLGCAGLYGADKCFDGARVAAKAELDYNNRNTTIVDDSMIESANRSGNKTGTWDMTEGGGVINGREYSQHAMERMAPDTPQVRAELSRRAEKVANQLGYEVGSKKYYDFCKEYVDPRNIPPSVIENVISSTKAIAGNKLGTFVHETADVKVIVNSSGKIVTVIPK